MPWTSKESLEKTSSEMGATSSLCSTGIVGLPENRDAAGPALGAGGPLASPSGRCLGPPAAGSKVNNDNLGKFLVKDHNILN